MSRHSKLFTALLSIIFCFSICTFTLTVSAVDADNDGYDDNTGEIIVTDPPYTDPVYTDDPYVEPVTDEPYVEPVTNEPYVEPATQEPYYEPETEPYYYEEPNDNNNYNENEQSSDLYVGGGQSYVEPLSTAPSAALYDSNHIIDDSVLSNGDWNDIAANLKNASRSDDGSDDFGFIKNNDSLGDNGEWMLIVGIMCLLLSAAGIAYLIVSSVMRRKKIAGGAYSSGQSAVAVSSAGGRYRSNSDYDDGYRVSSKGAQKKIDRSRKYDTADVKIPKSAQGTRYKNNSNGKRYK